MKLEVKIRPMGKPTMTAADKWKKRDCVLRYWDFTKILINEAKKQNFILSDKVHIALYFKPNKSLSYNKAKELIGKPHQVKPDHDNCAKAICDALRKDDQKIYESFTSKYYHEEDKIIITNYNGCIFF
jgi:Holliday junction resolvase RusA-like endonuclease